MPISAIAFVWSTAPTGEPWIATAVQGEGCDLFWPCIDHPLGVGHGGGDRLFHQDVDAPLQQGHAHFGVEAVRRRYDRRIQTGVHEVFSGGERGGAIGGGHALSRHGVGIEDGRQLDVAQLGQDAGVVAAHDAGARDADLERGLLEVHEDQALKLATAAMMRSCTGSSR